MMDQSSFSLSQTILQLIMQVCEDVGRIPREGGKRFEKRENLLSKRIKRSPGLTRAASGVCVTKIVGGRREKNPPGKEERGSREENIC